MPTNIKDITVEELKNIIDESVAQAFEENMEDMLALSSEKYIKSIEKSRDEYKKGEVVNLENLDV